jgi:hypothetical protein
MRMRIGSDDEGERQAACRENIAAPSSRRSRIVLSPDALSDARADFLLLPGQSAQRLSATTTIRTTTASLPLVSCIMASRGRIFPATHAIDCYRRQTYPHRELVIATAAVDGLLAGYLDRLDDPSIRLIEVLGFETPGRLRNAAIASSRGDVIAVWDDDDLSSPDRIALQYHAMNDAGATACFLSRELLWWPSRRRLAVSSARIWENSMLVRRADLPAYREDGVPGEDTDVAIALRATSPLLLLDRPEAYVYVAHGKIYAARSISTCCSIARPYILPSPNMA